VTIQPSRQALEKAVDELRKEKSEIQQELQESQRKLRENEGLVSRQEAVDVSNIATMYFESTVPPESEVETLMMDPVYGSVRIEPRLSRLVRHGLFARLGSIRQLAFVSVESANATHTRQAHSFGVSRFCEMAVDNFLRLDRIFVINSDKTENFQLKSNEKTEFIFLAKVCGLLHDVGHAPFGHNLDRLVSTQILESREGGQRADKYFSALYIRDFLKDTLETIGVDPDVVIRILCPGFLSKPKETPYTKYLNIVKNVIDSDLDVDRIDYLVRDSMLTGLVLASLNPTALIHGMRPVVNDQDGERIYSLAYDERVISHIEHAVYGRHSMYDHCYETDTRIACETMLANCFRDFLEKSSRKITELIKYTDEDLLSHILRYGDDSSPARSLARLLKLQRIYQTVFRQATNAEVRKGACLVVDEFLEERSENRVADPMRRFDDWRDKIVEGILSKEERWKTLVSVTPADRNEQSGVINLYLLKKKNGVYLTQRIGEFKPRIAQIVREYTKSMPQTRVFVHPLLEHRLVDAIRRSSEKFFEVVKKGGNAVRSGCYFRMTLSSWLVLP